jgi:hypothetical protein
MYDGVKAMIEKEKDLRGPKQQAPAQVQKVEEIKETQCGPQLKKPEDIIGYPKFPAGTKSLLMKHLTPELWAKY